MTATDITAQTRAEAALERIDLGLTPQEQATLPYLMRNLTYQQIGAAFRVTPDCVRKHTQHIATKLGVRGGRVAVVAAARERGLLS